MARENHTSIPTAALLDERLTRLDMRVLLALSSFRNHEHSAVWPSRASVAQRAGVHVTSVSKSTARLERFGWIKKEGGGGFCQPATYVLCAAQGVVPDDERTRQACTRRAALRTRRGQMEARGEWCESGDGGENGTGGHSGHMAGGDSGHALRGDSDHIASGHSDHDYQTADHWTPHHSEHRTPHHSAHTLYRKEEKKEEKKEEETRTARQHAARGALPPGVIRADELLTAGAGNDAGPQGMAQQAVDTAAAEPEAAGAANGDEVGQPPAGRKKRVQRPEDWAGVHIERPDGVADQVWADFCRMRRAKHAPITSTVISTIERDARRVGASLTDALDFMISRNHQGFIIEAWARAQSADVQGKLRRKLQEANNFAGVDYADGLDDEFGGVI